jgi:hypothetical protein
MAENKMPWASHAGEQLQTALTLSRKISGGKYLEKDVKVLQSI